MGEKLVKSINNIHKVYRKVNLVNPYILTPPIPNTFIGGIASVAANPSALATLLGVDVNRIQAFTIVGSDVYFKMIGNYSLSFTPQTSIRPLLTQYIDYNGLVTNLVSNCFTFCTKIVRLYFPGVITQTGISIFQDIFTPHILEMPNCTTVPAYWLGNWQTSSGTKTVVIPKCTNFGANEANNSVFTPNGAARMKLYAPISEQTSNAGGVEGDVAFVAAATASSVVYVPNYTKPSAITNLSAGTVTTTTIQLNFTPPSSTNTLDFYEVYVNGIYNRRITASGQNVTGLTTATSYKIEILAVDIYYNKSLVSNLITVTTL